MSFTVRFAIAFFVGLAAAVLLAPVAAAAVAAAGWHYPFPRIFDRTVMATLFIAIACSARGLRLWPLLRAGFRRPLGNLGGVIRGLATALVALAILAAAALAMSGVANFGAIATRAPKYALAAIAIAIIEEGFFRAFLVGGLRADIGRRPALVASAAFYAIAHLVRSPARFYVTGYVPGAGLATLAGSLDQFRDPAIAIPALIGLFLLGIVLGEAYLQTGTVYFSIGLHSGFVLGAKLWPKLIEAHRSMPAWLLGAGPVPLIGGAGAWVATVIVLMLLPRLTGAGGDQKESAAAAP